MNPAHRDKVLQAFDVFANGGTIKAALRAVGLDPAIFYKVKDSDAAIAAEYKRLRRARADMAMDETLALGTDEMTDHRVARVKNEILKGYAAAQDPDEFGQRVNHQVDTGPNIAAVLERARRRDLGATQPLMLDAQAVEVPAMPINEPTVTLTVEGAELNVDPFS